MKKFITRRTAISGALAVGGVGFAAVSAQKFPLAIRGPLDLGEAMAWNLQNSLISPHTLAREFSSTEISKTFPVNGSVPKTDAYRRFLDIGFDSWRLKVDGLVKRPLELSLAQLKSLPKRSQITLHSCDEGWSAIGEWTGVPLWHLLSLAGLAPGARYVVFHCMDKMSIDGQFYYESLDLWHAMHPQTLLAYGMNGQPLPVKHGAPLRLRVETQIGYKNAKYVERISVVDRLTGIGKGRGGWWEDFDNAVWFAGQ